MALLRNQTQLYHALLLVTCVIFIAIIVSAAENERLEYDPERQYRRNASSTTKTLSQFNISNYDERERRELSFSSSSLLVGASAVGMPLQSWQIQARSKDGTYRLDPYAFVEDARTKAQQVVTAHSAVTRRGPRMDPREELDDIDYQYLRQDSRNDPN